MSSIHPTHCPGQTDPISVHAEAMEILQGLVRNHFGKRSRGRPRQNTEVTRIKNGVRQMLRASGVSTTPELEMTLMNELLTRSLF
jgi:hypothetical protein